MSNSDSSMQPSVMPPGVKKNNGPSQDQRLTEINFLYWNAGGLSNSKYTELKTIIDRENVDVFAIAEASTDNTDYYKTENYILYTLPRGRQIASGIIVGVKTKSDITTEFKILHEMNINLFEAVELRLWKKQKQTKVIFVYNPPNNDPLTQILDNSIDKNTIIIGDFNCHSTKWGYKSGNPPGRILENFIDSTPMELLRSPSTFLSFKGERSTPDLAMVHINLVHQTTLKLLECCSGYGHRALFVKRKFMKIHRNSTDTLPRWNFKKADWTKYSTLTDRLLTLDLIVSTDLFKSYNTVFLTIEQCALSAIPRGKIRKFRPFWTKDLKELKKIRDQARAKAELTGTLPDNIALRKAQAGLKSAILDAKRTCFTNFAANLDFRKDGLRAHRFLSKLNNEPCRGANEPLVFNGRTHYGNFNKATAFAKHFASASRIPHVKRCKLDRLPPVGCLSLEDDNIFNSDFTLDELDRACHATKKGKSAGPDNIPSELYLNLGQSAKSTLLHLYNLIWTMGLPADWRKSIIIPILKPQKPTDNPNSYRPISLTNSCCKIMEKMVLNRLNFFLNNMNIISDFQAGFREKRSTIEQVTFLAQCIKDGFHRKESTLTAFIDFKSAYDRIWKRKLIHKLIKSGIHGKMLKWLKSFLAQRIAKVKYRDEFSHFVHLRNGLPQGAVLSCTLFNIMINDLVTKLQEINGVKVLLFADDVAIYTTHSDIQKANHLMNEALIALEEWCRENLMEVNPSKTVCELFTLSTKDHNVSLVYKNTTLNRVKEACYLGVFLDSKLNWKKHSTEIARKGTDRLRLLKRLSGITWGSTQNTLTTVFKTYIRPALDYGGELIATASESCGEILDKVQNKALRLITGAACSTPISAMEIQTGLEPLAFRRDKQLLNMSEKCLRLPLSHWTNYVPSVSRLKTHKTFLDVADDLRAKYSLSWANREPIFFNHLLPLKLCLPAFDLTIGLKDKKYEALPAALKAYSLETIYSRYPNTQWLHVYTDGSSAPNGNSGSGFFCEGKFEGSVAVGMRATNFDAEMEAICHALANLMSIKSHSKAIFLVDSQAAILAVCSYQQPDSSRVARARSLFYNLFCSGWNIAFQWVPSHCGIPGNERADKLAKDGSLLPQPSYSYPYLRTCSEISRGIGRAVNEYQVLQSTGKAWNTLLTQPVPYDLPRQVATANFRILTSHDFLRGHLHRIGVFTSPDCPLCPDGNFMDFNHIQTCSALSDKHYSVANFFNQAELYWAARKKLWSLDFS